MTAPTVIYFGRFDAMVSEVSAFDFCSIGVSAKQCAYLVMPYGDAQWDTEYFASKLDAARHARYLAKAFNVKHVWID